MSIQGNVDWMQRDIVCGWVWRPGAPDRRLVVEVVVGQAIVAKAVAISYRPDLEIAGVGDGRYGFVIEFHPPLDHDAKPELRIDGIGGEIPTPSSWSRDFDEVSESDNRRISAPSTSVDVAVSTRIDGHVDSLRHDGVSGWVWLPDSPNERLTVEAILRGEVIASGCADMLRPDLRSAGKGDGAHAFELTFDPELPREFWRCPKFVCAA